MPYRFQPISADRVEGRFEVGGLVWGARPEGGVGAGAGGHLIGGQVAVVLDRLDRGGERLGEAGGRKEDPER